MLRIGARVPVITGRRTFCPSGGGFPRQTGRIPHERAAHDSTGLLCAVADGDRAAFDGLYRLLRPRVFRLARRVLRDAALAEETTQEVLLEVWLTAGRFDACRATATTWVLTIAHRRAIDRLRAERAAADRDLRFAAATAEVDGEDAAAPVLRLLERHRLRSGLVNLSALQRQALTLAYWDGHTYREVAGLLGVPLPTVKSRIRDALTHLRHHMDLA